MDGDGYNYTIFPPEDDSDRFAGWAEFLKVGARSPDPELTDLATGAPARLSDHTGRGLTVVEFGSLT